jgi:plasmid replication initiation protein
MRKHILAENELSTQRDQRNDERNVARLGIISILSRINVGVTTWQSEFSVRGSMFRVECAAPYGRPHGIDTDVILAIQTLFVRQGCPEHNWVHTTAYELKMLTGLPDNGRTYTRIRESIKRLWGTGFVVSQGWQDANGKVRRWQNTTLRYIDRLQYHELEADTDPLPGLDPASTLSIKLGEQVSESIRARHTQLLSGALMWQLEQPPARALYRLLEAHRLLESGERAMLLEVGLESWRQACGVACDRPELFRRILSPAHEELTAIGYLESVEYQGRGKKQMVLYRFAADDAPDPALVEMLIGVGVASQMALQLAREQGERIEEAVRFVRLRKEGGFQVRNPGGLVVDYLQNDGKYAPTEVIEQQRKQKAVNRKAEDDQARTRQAELELEQERIRLNQLEPVAQFQALRSSLKLLLEKPLGKEGMMALEGACLAGTLSAVATRDGMVQAMARMNGQEFVAQLRVRLRLEGAE